MDVTGGNYNVLYRLKVASNESSSTVAVLKALATRNGVADTVIAQREIRANEFNTSNEWQVFALPVNIRNDDTNVKFIVEHRQGVTDLYCDWIRVEVAARGLRDLLDENLLVHGTNFLSAPAVFGAQKLPRILFPDAVTVDGGRHFQYDPVIEKANPQIILKGTETNGETVALKQSAGAVKFVKWDGSSWIDKGLALESIHPNVLGINSDGKLVLTQIGTKAFSYASLTDYKLKVSDIDSAEFNAANKICKLNSKGVVPPKHVPTLGGAIYDDFTDTLNQWSGSFTINTSYKYAQSTKENEDFLILEYPTIKNGMVKAKINCYDDTGTFLSGIVFRYKDSNNYYEVTGYSTNQIRVRLIDADTPVTLATWDLKDKDGNTISWNHTDYYTWEVYFIGNIIEVYVNNVRQGGLTDNLSLIHI